MDLERRLTLTYTIDRVAPGIMGSDRSDARIRAVYDTLAA